MSERRSPRSIRQLDLSKYGVFLLLALAAIVLLVTRSCQQPVPAAPEPDATLVPTFTAVATVAQPVLVSPLTGLPVESGMVRFEGSAQPGATLQVLLNGQELDQVTVAGNGQWSLESQIDRPGEYVVRLRILDEAEQVVNQAAPLTLSVVMPSATMQLPTFDDSLFARPLTVGPVTLTGSGEPGTNVQILVNSQEIGVAPVDPDGRWALAAEIRAPGAVALSLQTIDESGQVVAKATPALVAIQQPALAIVAVAPTPTATQTNPPTAAPTSTTDANRDRLPDQYRHRNAATDSYRNTPAPMLSSLTVRSGGECKPGRAAGQRRGRRCHRSLHRRYAGRYDNGHRRRHVVGSGDAPRQWYIRIDPDRGEPASGASARAAPIMFEFVGTPTATSIQTPIDLHAQIDQYSNTYEHCHHNGNRYVNARPDQLVDSDINGYSYANAIRPMSYTATGRPTQQPQPIRRPPQLHPRPLNGDSNRYADA